MATFVLDGGLDIVTNRIKGTGTEPLNVGWATGTQTTTTRADTGLGPTMVEKLVDLTTSAGTDHTAGTSTRQTTTTTNDTYQVVATRTATGTGTVVAAALFDAASGGNCFLKGDFAGIALVSGDSILFTIKAVFDN
jgi:hypothetical protein